ncbi:MAG: hypothetical protein ACKVQK_14700 [Burkholderiales bacterium]
MPGIEFLTDRHGRKKAVMINLKKHKDLWEDLFDAYLVHQRRNEPRESLAEVRRLITSKTKRRSRA